MAEEYRVLERVEDGRWQPFAVAYRRADGFFLFSPAWRAPRPLDVAGLAALSAAHFPTGSVYRWAPGVSMARVNARHPVDFLREAMNVSRGAEKAPPDLIGSLTEALRRFSPAPATGLRVRGGGGRIAEVPDVATLLRRLEQGLASDPVARAAFADLSAALDNPQTRELVVSALHAFARAAKGTP